MIHPILGRLTLAGSPATENLLRALVRDAARAILRATDPANVKALVLCGGYGRGEGGVRSAATGERPANNLDLILFTVGLRAPARATLTRAVNRRLDVLRQRAGMGIDFSAVDACAVERDRVRLLWYDVRHGHKLLAGDPAFLPSLRHVTAEAIDPREISELLVNRGALLVLNELIAAAGATTPERREALLTHRAKAIIGYGDAFLMAQGPYHWSYVERQARMAVPSTEAPPDLKHLYEAAMRYRFIGDELSAERLLTFDGAQLRKVLSAVHGAIEELQPGRSAGFHGYVRTSLRHDIGEMASSFRGMARGALTLVRRRSKIGDAPFSIRMAARVGGERAVVRALFPLVAYGRGGEEDLENARRLLGVTRARSLSAKSAWLRMWGRAFDPNLRYTLERLGLTQAAA